MFRKTILALLFTGASLSAHAGNWGSPTTITGYYVYDSGGAYIKTENNQNPDGCSSSYYLALNSQATFFKNIWAQVMAAQVSGQTVSLRYEGCQGPYPLVIAIAIPNVW